MYFDSWDDVKNEVRTRMEMEVDDERRKDDYCGERNFDFGMSQQEFDDLDVFLFACTLQGILEERWKVKRENQRKRPGQDERKEGRGMLKLTQLLTSMSGRARRSLTTSVWPLPEAASSGL